MALDPVHLSRWRGHALAAFGDPDAVCVLTKSLNELDPTFTRAEIGLRVDLFRAFTTAKEHSEAANQASKAANLAAKIESVRQKRRLTK
jgi:hypothetical protein